jgi:hypothetical protein
MRFMVTQDRDVASVGGERGEKSSPMDDSVSLLALEPERLDAITPGQVTRLLAGIAPVEAPPRHLWSNPLPATPAEMRAALRSADYLQWRASFNRDAGINEGATTPMNVLSESERRELSPEQQWRLNGQRRAESEREEDAKLLGKRQSVKSRIPMLRRQIESMGKPFQEDERPDEVRPGTGAP